METETLITVPIVGRELIWLPEGVVVPLVYLNAVTLPELPDLIRVAMFDNHGWAVGSLKWQEGDGETVLMNVWIDVPVALSFQLRWPVGDVKVIQTLKPDVLGLTTMPYGKPLSRDDMVFLTEVTGEYVY